MSMAALLLSLGGVLAVLGLWAFWVAPRIGQPRLDVAQRSAMIALHTVTAIAILSAGILYLEEQQWSPRFDVQLKADTHAAPQSNPPSAMIQLAIAITNKTETRQAVNFIDVSAFGIRGAVHQDPAAPQDLAATPIYRFVTRQANEAGADETAYQFVEIPVSCAWRLVRVVVRVPKPPAQPPRPGKRRSEYERKLLVPTGEACST
jgi:hypothetical protein